MARSDWAALQVAAVQIAYRHDTRPFLPLVKGLARQTNRGVTDNHVMYVYHITIVAIVTSNNLTCTACGYHPQLHSG